MLSNIKFTWKKPWENDSIQSLLHTRMLEIIFSPYVCEGISSGFRLESVLLALLRQEGNYISKLVLK
jgi:hypothetical protein